MGFIIREGPFDVVFVNVTELFLNACFKVGVEVGGFVGWGVGVDFVASDTAGVVSFWSEGQWRKSYRFALGRSSIF